MVKPFDRPGPAQASFQLPRLKEGRGELASVLKETHDSLRSGGDFHLKRPVCKRPSKNFRSKKAAGSYARTTSAKGELGIALTI